VEDRESSPQVRLDLVFGWLNLSFAHNAYVHRRNSFSAPACRRPGRPDCLLTHRAILRRNPFTQI